MSLMTGAGGGNGTAESQTDVISNILETAVEAQKPLQLSARSAVD